MEVILLIVSLMMPIGLILVAIFNYRANKELERELNKLENTISRIDAMTKLSYLYIEKSED